MGEQFVGYGSHLAAGPYLRKTRQDCVDLVRPNNTAQLNNNVTACMLDTFTETDKSIYASRQYILTLWPAFVGAIVALAPDPAYMMYDNMWWAALFAVTCGGLPGLDASSSPPHHVEAHSESEGRSMCEAWQYTAAQPKLMSKTEAMGNQTRGMAYIHLEWACFCAGFALYLSFCIYFAQSLGPSFTFSFEGDVYRGATWYYISCSPAILGAIFELLQSRVDLYEPAPAIHDETEMDSLTANAAVSKSSQAPMFQKVNVGSTFGLWLKIAIHQWRRTKYRILVRDSSSHWFFLIGNAMTGIARMTVFALGSVTMGNILFLPVPDDLYLFVLLLFTTAIPRQLWPGFWANGNRGADLVVWVNSIQLVEVGPVRHASA